MAWAGSVGTLQGSAYPRTLELHLFNNVPNRTHTITVWAGNVGTTLYVMALPVRTMLLQFRLFNVFQP